MKLDLATPQKSLATLEVEEVTLPTVYGEAMILPGHARLVSELVPGTLSYRSRTDSKSFPIGAGFVEVKHDHVVVLCDEADLN